MLENIHAFIKQNQYDFEVESLDGKWRKTIDKNNQKVWYIGTDHGNDLITFSFGDFRDTDKRFYFTSRETLSESDSKALLKFKEKVEKNKEIKHAIAKELVQTLWERWNLEDVGGVKLEADYLLGKRIPRPPGVHVYQAFDNRQNVLVIPLRTPDGELWNIQQIYASGDKAFHPGGRTKGCFFEFGSTVTDYILVGEGFATCAAAHLATGLTTVCAFNLNNLSAAVESLGARGFPFQKIVMLADFDGATYIKTGKNPGMLEVQKICREYQTRWASPIAPEEFPYNETNVDFADVWKDEHPDQVNANILSNRMGSDILDYSFQVTKIKTDSLEAELLDSKSEIEGAVPSESAIQPMAPEKLIEARAALARLDMTPGPPVAVMEFKAPKTMELKHQGALEFPTQKAGFMLVEMKNGKVVETPDFVGFAKFIANEYCLLANDAFTYIYRDGYYERISRGGLKSLVSEHVKPNLPPYVVAHFVEAACNGNFVKLNDLVEPTGMINLSNGILDVRNKHLRPHTPEFFFQYKLPHEYIPDAKCPQWLSFLERTFEGDQALVDVCAEIFGYVLLGGEPFLHKAFVLSGEGRNGKSTFLDVLKYLIGKTNFSSIPVANLDKPFSVIMADGMLANIVGETTAKEINSEAFKTACSGEELIASQKGLPEYPLAFNARLILACNKLPHLGDATTGAYEKFFILPFNRYIHENERVALFAKRHLFPETPGVINWALAGLDRLILRGQLPSIQAVRDQNIELREEIDTVFAWMKDAVKFDSGEVVTLKIKNWYPHYKNWTMEQERHSVGPLQFSKRIMAEVRKNPHLRITKPQNTVAITGRIEFLGSTNTGRPLGV